MEDARSERCFRRFLETGQAELLEELIRLYRRPLTLFIDGYIHDRTESDAICLDAFVELVRCGDRFLGRSSLKTYLYAIGRNLALRHRRKWRREFVVDVSMLRVAASSPEELLEQDDRKRQLYLAMGQIKPEYAEVLFLAFFEEMNHAAIQLVLGLSNQQVVNRLHRAKAVLRKQLEADGFEYW